MNTNAVKFLIASLLVASASAQVQNLNFGDTATFELTQDRTDFQVTPNPAIDDTVTCILQCPNNEFNNNDGNSQSFITMQISSADSASATPTNNINADSPTCPMALSYKVSSDQPFFVYAEIGGDPTSLSGAEMKCEKKGCDGLLAGVRDGLSSFLWGGL